VVTSHAAKVDADLPPIRFDPGWVLIEEGFNLAREHEIESVFTIGNGYVGTRGSLAEPTPLSFPATFLAGVFDRRTPDGMPELALAPDWTSIRVTVEGHRLRLDEGEPLEYRRILDMARGILWREWLHRDRAGRETRLRGFRLACLADRHVLLQTLVLTPQNYTGRLRVEMRMEFAPRYLPASPLEPLELVPLDPTAPPISPLAGYGSPLVVEYRTRHSDLVAAFATASRARPELPVYHVEVRPGRAVERWEGEIEIGRSVRIDRIVTVRTSRDADAPAAAALQHLETRLARRDTLVQAHIEAWASRWATADVAIEGDELAQRAIRFAVYHLIAGASPEDERASIGARGLTGDAYKGHVFWDTEIFMLPFYTLTAPEVARALLMYRYHTLGGARKKAAAMGYRGAMYAWESADTGEEVTPTSVVAPTGQVMQILTGEQEQHISADVAYAAWQYWQVTGDDAFFREAGAELLVETARFWASRAGLEADGRYHIRGVIGPDEYHESIDDNAYTNLMAQWNLETGAEAWRLLRERWPEEWRRLRERLALEEREPTEWVAIAGAMETRFDPGTALFEQFQGYFDLEEVDLARFADRTVPMDLLLGREAVQRSKIVKQADVVMALLVLWDRIPPDAREANFRYYEPRTGHGSSLSPAIHAVVAARLGDLALAQRYFVQAAEIDLGNNMGNASGGVHMAALGGLWQAAVTGFAGIRVDAAGLRIDPCLPESWRSLRCAVRWRGRRVSVTLGQSPPEIRVEVEGEGSVPVRVAGRAVEVRAGRPYAVEGSLSCQGGVPR
jgi:kojibiose phosphorylase